MRRRHVAPVYAPADVSLDLVPPGAAIVALWMADYRGAHVPAMVAAREEVRRVMPDLAAQLDRAAWTLRTSGRFGPVVPCLSQPHTLEDGVAGLRSCTCCGAILEGAP